MESNLYAVLLEYKLNGSIHEKEYFVDSYENAMQIIEKWKKADGKAMKVLWATIHKTYFDDGGILVAEYEREYCWESGSNEDND